MMIRKYILFFGLLPALFSCSSPSGNSADENKEPTKFSIIQDDSVPSFFFNKDIPFRMIFPKSYGKADSLPILFLLHGHGATHYSFTQNIFELSELADQYDIILLCVEGEKGWYMDSPKKTNWRYETFIMNELMPYVFQKYKVCKSAAKRGIAGYSMGGFGAVYLGLKHPDSFVYVGSTSGGLDILPFPDNWDLSTVLGPQEENEELWKQNSPYYMLDKVKGPLKFKLVMDCGESDFFFAVNNAFSEKLDQKGIEYEYKVSSGGHDWDYFGRTIPNHLKLFAEVIE